MLNLDQSPEVLNRIHGEEDYYWYLRSQEYQDTVLYYVAKTVDRIGLTCLDVGCGEALLGDMVKVAYVGFDGSEPAIARALKRNPQLDVYVDRIEEPKIAGKFGTLVMSGLFSVLVDPTKQVEFVEMYREKYQAEFLILADLVRTDVIALRKRYKFLSYDSLIFSPPVNKGKPLDGVRCLRMCQVYQLTGK